MAVFRDTMRPAISTGLSVTRVGGVGQNKRQKGLASGINKALASFKSAEEYAHFGSELSPEAAASLELGKRLYLLFNQVTGETYSLMSQQLILDVLLGLVPGDEIDIPGMKAAVAEYSAKVKDEKDNSNFDQIRDELKAKFVKLAPKPEEPAPEETPAEPEKDKDGKPIEKKPEDKKEDDKKDEKKDVTSEKPDVTSEKSEASSEKKETPDQAGSDKGGKS
jgi:hypothetical protein